MDCVDNEAEYGAAIYIRQNSSASVKSCTFSGNIGTKKGGGIDVDEYSSLTLSNSTLTSKPTNSTTLSFLSCLRILCLILFWCAF